MVAVVLIVTVLVSFPCAVAFLRARGHTWQEALQTAGSAYLSAAIVYGMVSLYAWAAREAA